MSLSWRGIYPAHLLIQEIHPELSKSDRPVSWFFTAFASVGEPWSIVELIIWRNDIFENFFENFFWGLIQPYPAHDYLGAACWSSEKKPLKISHFKKWWVQLRALDDTDKSELILIPDVESDRGFSQTNPILPEPSPRIWD